MLALTLSVVMAAAPDAGAPDAGVQVVVARLFGRDIYLDVLLQGETYDAKQLPPELREKLAERLRDQVIVFANEAYAKEHGLEPTKAETERCLAGLRRSKIYDGLPKEAKELIAEAEVRTFKVNRAIYKEFGGRVVFSMTGFDPIDAQQKLLERYEAKKQITFAGAQVREAVFEYFKDQNLRELDPPNIKFLYEKPRCERFQAPGDGGPAFE